MMSVKEATNEDFEYKVTIIALIYAIFKIGGDYGGIVDGHPLYIVLLYGCRAVFLSAHVWFYMEYKRVKKHINSIEYLSAFSKYQRRKSINYTLRWIYFRALVVGGLHLLLYPGAESLPLLVGTPVLSVFLTKDNPDWQ